MRQQNLEYLSEQLKYTGFKDSLVPDLKMNMEKGEDAFTLQYQTKYGQDTANASLNFHKSVKEDMYFFNSYVLEVTKGNKDTNSLKQKFYISNKEDNISLKEGYNLLEGRAVHKELTPREGPQYHAWVQLDFKQTDNSGNFERKTFHQNYGYDLEATLAKHPIIELGDERTKRMLMDSLERGNRQSVTYKAGDEERKLFIEAVPQFKSLNFYDKSMQRLKPEQLAAETGPSQTTEKVNKQTQKQDVAGEENNTTKNKGKKTNQRAGIS